MPKRSKKGSNGKLIAIIVCILAIFGISKLTSLSSTSSPTPSCEEDPERKGYCLRSSNNYDAVAIVVGNTKNTPKPTLTLTSEIKEVLSDVFYNTPTNGYMNVTVISVAGDNHSIDFKGRFAPASSLTISENNFKDMFNSLNKSLNQPANEDGADYLGGIIEAYRAIGSSAKNPAIIVIGSGYSDSGVLDFAKNAILDKYQSDPSSIPRLLANGRGTQEYSLSNASIFWYNIGKVAEPQKSMNKFIPDTKAIYASALDYLGATTTFIDANIPTSNQSSLASEYYVTPTFATSLTIGDTFEVTENIGRFAPNVATLVTPKDEVKQTLKNFASKFQASKNIKLKVTGYIAICVDSDQLSKQRADVIKDILVELGIPADKIIVDGKAGAPPNKGSGKDFVCEDESSLPDTERRTVKIEVIKG